MQLYRISPKAYINDLSGVGAGLYGGRWNPKGLNMLYTAGSISLATLEHLVHNFQLLSTAHICLAKIEINDQALGSEVAIADLPQPWNEHPENRIDTQLIGKQFLGGEYYYLKVPSAIVPGECNILLNPRHQLHTKTHVIEVIDPFKFDHRLLDFANASK